MERPYYSLPLWISALLALLQSLLPAILAQEWSETLLYILLLAVVAIPIYSLHSRRSHHPPIGRLFYGPGMAAQGPDRVWRREVHESELLRTLNSPETTLMVLTGQSGAGKSVLLRTHILPALHREHGEISVHFIDTYENLPLKLSLIEKIDLDGPQSEQAPLFLILDQAEQLHHKSPREKLDIRKVVQHWLRCGHKVLIAVREDFYYGLRFLGPLDPPPSSAFELPGIDPHDPRELEQVKHDLLQVAEPDCVELILGELQQETDSQQRASLSPLALQVVGVMLERAYAKVGRIGKDYYSNRLQGRDELIKEFFSVYVSASPHPQVSQSVLLILSTESRLRKSLSLDQIFRATYYSSQEIRETLDFFAQSPGLIVQPSQTTYEWAHDQLATGFRQYSASEIDPTLRDNVFFSVEAQKERKRRPSAVLSLEESKEARVAWNILLILLTVGTIARLSIGQIFPQVHITEAPPARAVSDLYVAAGLAHLAWAVYVVRLNTGFFSRVRNGPIFSWRIFTLWGFLVMGFAWFCAEIWIASIGAAALALGANFASLASQEGLARHAALRFRRTGVLTCLGGAVVVGLGLGYVSIMAMVNTHAIALMTFGSSAAFVALAGPAIRLHTSKQSIETFLGLLDRRTG